MSDRQFSLYGDVFIATSSKGDWNEGEIEKVCVWGGGGG